MTGLTETLVAVGGGAEQGRRDHRYLLLSVSRAEAAWGSEVAAVSAQPAGISLVPNCHGDGCDRGFIREIEGGGGYPG